MQRHTGPVTQPRGARRDVNVVLIAVVVLVGAALLKPWGPPNGGALPEASAPSLTTAPAQPTPSPTPFSEESLVAGFCLQPSGWRIFTTEQWSDRDLRVWRSAVATPDATGAGDGLIPVTPVASRSVMTLGFCAPVAGAERPPLDATVTLYRVDRGAQPQILAARRVQPAERSSALGSVFSPPLSKNVDVGDRTGWTSGLYVFRVGGFAPGSYVRWLAVAVDILPNVPSSAPLQGASPAN